MKNNLQYLNALRAFESAARNESFAAASKELSVSHSVVSRHIRNLESWFELELFSRAGNRVELNQQGRALYSEIATPFQTLRDVSEKFSSRTQSNKTSLSIVAEPAIASRWLRRRVTEFCETYQNVEINLLPAWHLNGGEGINSDLVVHFPGRISMVTKSEELLFPIVAYPACAPLLIDSDESGNLFETKLENLPLVHDNGRRVWKSWFDMYCPGNERWENGKVYADFPLAIDAAVDGEGIILADDIICAEEIENGSLVRIDDRACRCAEYVISENADSDASPVSTTLRDWLLSEAADCRQRSMA